VEASRLKPPLETDEWPKPPRHSKGTKKFVLEYRLRLRDSKIRVTGFFHRWRTYWTRYNTEKARAQALETLNQKDNLFEYRIPD